MTGRTLALELMAAAIVAAAATHLVKETAPRRSWLDRPNQRSSHDRPTPRGGGLAIVGVTVIGSSLTLLLAGRVTTQLLAVIGAATVLAWVSWVDDLRSLRASIRFAVHLLVAVVAVVALGPIKHVDIPGMVALDLSGFGIPLTILWIAGLTNIYNFMDGIDGIAGLQAVLGGATWLSIGVILDDPTLVVVSGLVAASSLGFLVHNWAPASIFMGDVGSAFLGYLFAVFALRSPEEPRLLFAAALVVWPFLFDGSFTLFRRLARRENVTQAHRSHLYQRLVQSGWSHRKVSNLYGTFSLAGGLFAVALLRGWAGWQMVYLFVPVAALSLWLLTRRAERRIM